MKQLLILSGKGGTGKTTVAAAFIKLSSAKVYADCDVDAPNLHIVMQQLSEPKKTNFYGLPKAEIDVEACICCGACLENCRFQAIELKNGQFLVDPFSCEGCGVCGEVCSTDAISFKPEVSGDLLLYEGSGTTFSTAKLKMGNGASGKLVSEVKNQIKEAAASAELVIVDGSPGIGCPVIASLSGADMVLIVAEPSLSGISDMERIIKTAEIFGTKIMLCVNKYDTHIGNTERIEQFCREKQISFAGKIPFDLEAVNAVNKGETIVDSACISGDAVRLVFRNVAAELFNEGKKIAETVVSTK
ncbi:MAG: ATP-binding protein [Eubacteriales bacterium]|nr:ATP-binding protein [Eubacteriales bacterium]